MDNRIVSVDIVDGELIITYQDGSTESLGPVPNLDPEELSAAVQRNTGDIAGLKRDVAALQEAVAGLGTSFETAEDDIDDLQEDVAELKNDLLDGTFTVNNAQNAEQLTSTVGIEDKTPYLFRTSGGSVDIGDREDVKKLVGGTVAWNQLVQNFAILWYRASASSTTVSYNTENRTATFDNIGDTNGRLCCGVASEKNHVYFSRYSAKSTVTGTLKYELSRGWASVQSSLSANTEQNISCVLKVSATDDSVNRSQFFIDTTDPYTLTIKDYQFTDLTLALGTTIANYVYSLETATAGAGVAWLKTHFPKQFNSGYQAYDAGSLQSVSGLTEHKMVGFNLFNSEAGTVRIIGGMQYQITGTYTALSLDGTAITPDSNGKFTPTNNGTLTVTGGNATDTCVHFVWDGEKDGTYEPYKEYTYPLDSYVVLRGIQKVDANGNLYYDGDEYLPDGTVNRRYRELDFDGSEDWSLQSINSNGIANFMLDLGVNNKYANGERAICNRFTVQNTLIAVTTEEGFILSTLQHVYIRISSSKADTVTGFKTWLASNPTQIMYELATPTTETALPYQATQIVDDWGTEEYVLADGAFPVPVGHVTMYQNNLRAKLEMSPDSPDGDGLYVVQQESGENTYVPLASTATIQDILTRLTALENA